MSTKSFPLSHVLSITTPGARLLCDIGGVYEILNFITGDNLFTHQLPRAVRFAAPLLLKEHPELVAANACLSNLDKWVQADKTERKTECAKMWLTELLIMFPDITPKIEVASHEDAWLSMDPMAELIGMVGEEKVIAVEA